MASKSDGEDYYLAIVLKVPSSGMMGGEQMVTHRINIGTHKTSVYLNPFPIMSPQYDRFKSLPLFDEGSAQLYLSSLNSELI